MRLIILNPFSYCRNLSTISKKSRYLSSCPIAFGYLYKRKASSNFLILLTKFDAVFYLMCNIIIFVIKHLYVFYFNFRYVPASRHS